MATRATLIAAIMMIVAAPQIAGAEVVTATLLCPDGTKIEKTLPCEPGDLVTAMGLCPDRSIVTEFVSCYKVDYILGDWGVGVGGFFIDAATSDGPRVGGPEVVFVGDLNLGVNWASFHVEFAPGGGFGDGPTFSLSEFAGIEFRPLSWLGIDVGAQHRVTFDQGGANLNALYGAIGVRFRLVKGWMLAARAAFGSAWFSIVETEAALLPPGIELPPPNIVNTWGFSASTSLHLEHHF